MGLLRSIFGLLDSDEDGKISAEKCEISQIHPLVLEIIQEVLFEMETKGKTMDFEEFNENVRGFGLEEKILKVFYIRK